MEHEQLVAVLVGVVAVIGLVTLFQASSTGAATQYQLAQEGYGQIGKVLSTNAPVSQFERPLGHAGAGIRAWT